MISIRCVLIDGGNLTLRRNTIHDNRDAGVKADSYWSGKKTSLTLEDNDIVENGSRGVEIRSADATLRRNTITGNEKTGIYLKGGHATVHDNDLRANHGGALKVKSKAWSKDWDEDEDKVWISSTVDDKRNKKE